MHFTLEKKEEVEKSIQQKLLWDFEWKFFSLLISRALWTWCDWLNEGEVRCTG